MLLVIVVYVLHVAIGPIILLLFPGTGEFIHASPLLNICLESGIMLIANVGITGWLLARCSDQFIDGGVVGFHSQCCWVPT